MRFISTLAVTAVAALALTACSQESQTQAQHEHEGHEAQETSPAGDDSPAMSARFEIEANSEGYVPAMVHVEPGQEVTLIFTRTTDETCATEVVMPMHDIEVDLPLNEPVEVTFVADESGEIEYSCGMNMWKGKVVVN